MHGFVKKGLLVSIASSALVLGGAGFAAADSATASGSTTGNEGAVSGNVVQGAADVPVNVCGDAGGVLTAMDGSHHNTCTTEDNSAWIMGTSSGTEGIGSGNVAGADLNAPVQVCGVDVQGGSVSSGAYGNTCEDENTWASASATTTNDSGLVSGNVIQLAANAPISACGDSVGLLNFDSSAAHNTCTNG